MPCALCQSDNDRIHVTKHIGGEERAAALCEPCAKEWGLTECGMDESRLDDLFEACAEAKAAREKAGNEPKEARKPRRFAMVIGLREEKIEEYRRLHASVWPEVLQTIHRCNMRNFSIYLRRWDDGQHYLFGYYEYTGADHSADQARMAADPATQRWWALTEPCQKPVANHHPGEWWAAMEEVFHCD